MSDNIQNIRKGLMKTFRILAAVDICLFIGIFFMHRAGISLTLEPQTLRITGIILLVGAATLSAAVPILLRTLFTSKTTKNKRFDLADYLSLQTTLVVLPMIGAVFAALAYLFLVPELYLYGSAFFALYGVYSAIPDRKKIQGELNYFEIFRK